MCIRDRSVSASTVLALLAKDLFLPPAHKSHLKLIVTQVLQPIPSKIRSLESFIRVEEESRVVSLGETGVELGHLPAPSVLLKIPQK